MLMNYFKIAFRKMRRQKGYTIINITGLGIGLATCAIIMLWISNENSFDSFLTNGPSVYRLIRETQVNREETLDTRIPYPLAESIMGKIPEVKSYTRYQGVDSWKITYGEKSFYNDFLSTADSTFFEIFTFPFIKGDPETAMDNRNSIVITESMARKYFGTEDPMGNVLSIIQPDLTFTVTGVIKDVPENSHLHFDCIIPVVNFWEWWDGRESGWNMNMFYTYILLQPGSSSLPVSKKIAEVLNENMPQQQAGIRMQKLADVHLRSESGWDLDNYKQGNSSTLIIFSLAALGVLLLAIINFINLATARSANRAREVGLRKINGANRQEIIIRFLGESIIISFLAFLLAMIIIYFGLPLLNSLADRQIEFSKLFEPQLFLTLLGVTLVTGILSGSYPAFYLSSFQPERVLKGEQVLVRHGQASLRRILVVLQFTLTIFLITISVIINRQLEYMRSKDLGMDISNIIIAHPGFIPDFHTLKSTFLNNPDIISVTYSDPPNIDQRGISNVTWEGKDPSSTIQFFPVSVDQDYLKTFRASMLTGRFFSDEFPADETGSVIINETAARIMKMEKPVGKMISIGNRSQSIIGIIRDFHQTSISKPVEPMILIMNSGDPQICLRYAPLKRREAISFIEKTLKSYDRDPARPLRYEILEERIDKFYSSESKLEVILSVFMVIALLTACLGLIGLASYMAEKRTREIGLRRTFGGSVVEMLWLQTLEFSRLILLSGVIAAPFAYWAAKNWLSGYAYHINPGIGILLATTLFAFIIGILIVGYQSMKAAMENPVDSLKHE